MVRGRSLGVSRDNEFSIRSSPTERTRPITRNARDTSRNGQLITRGAILCNLANNRGDRGYRARSRTMGNNRQRLSKETIAIPGRFA